MNIEEVLKQAEALVFAQTGRKLEHLQKTVLRGTIQGQTYMEIAEESGFSESHVKNVGHELWNILSSALGEKVTKSNFRAIFKLIKKVSLRKQFLEILTRQSITILIFLLTESDRLYLPQKANK